MGDVAPGTYGLCQAWARYMPVFLPNKKLVQTPIPVHLVIRLIILARIRPIGLKSDAKPSTLMKMWVPFYAKYVRPELRHQEFIVICEGHLTIISGS